MPGEEVMLRGLYELVSGADQHEHFSTFGFIDCNCLDTSRPGGGPAEEGIDAARWHPLIQGR